MCANTIIPSIRCGNIMFKYITMYRDAAVTIRSALLTSRAQYKSAFIRRFTIERSCPFLCPGMHFFWGCTRKKKKRNIYMCVCTYRHVLCTRAYNKTEEKGISYARHCYDASSGHAENVFHPRFIKRNSECIER